MGISVVPVIGWGIAIVGATVIVAKTIINYSIDAST